MNLLLAINRERQTTCIMVCSMLPASHAQLILFFAPFSASLFIFTNVLPLKCECIRNALEP
jgi:hypothetical protein